MNFKKIFLAFLLTLITFSAYSLSFTNTNNAENTNYVDKHFNKVDKIDVKDSKITLTTLGRGDGLYSWFGHSALGVESYDEENLYDYGVFEFNDDFYLNFILGRLYFRLLPTPIYYRYYDAISENRSITKLDLNFTQEQKNNIISFLHNNSLNQNSVYLYHHYFDNCSTRPRDIINNALDNNFKKWSESQESNNTLRQLINRSMGNNVFIMWVLNYIQGPLIDKKITKWQEMFLPYYLEKYLIEYSNTLEKPLVGDIEVVNTDKTRKQILDHNYPVVLVSFIFGIVLALVTYILITIGFKSKKTFLRVSSRVLIGTLLFVIFTFLTIISSALLFMMIFSNHDFAYNNINILFINPILILLSINSLLFIFDKINSYQRIQKISRFFSIITFICLLLPAISIYVFYQSNLPIILTVLPLYLVLGFTNNIKETRVKKKKVKKSDIIIEEEVKIIESDDDQDIILEPFKPRS